MDNQTLQKIKDILVKSNNIGIAVGANPSVDTMAGALSLYLLLKAANKQVSVASPTQPIVELSSLVGINRVQSSLGGEANDLVVSFPYVEGEIEKVSYTLEEGFLNIIVKASEQGLSFDENDVKYTRGSGAIDLLIVVGTPRLSELEDIVDAQKLRDVRIINIDNKEANQGFGDVVLVSSRFAAVSEQVADLAMALGFRLDQDVAQNLLTGITTETKNFQTPNVTPLTFEMMALLMKTGAARRNIETRSPLAPSDDRGDEYGSRDQRSRSAGSGQAQQDDRRPQQRQDDRDQRPTSRQQLDRRLQEERQQREDRRPREEQRQRDDQRQADRRPHAASSGQAQDDRDQRPQQRQDDRRPNSASSGQGQADQRPQPRQDDRRRFDDRDQRPQPRQDDSSRSAQGRQDDRRQDDRDRQQQQRQDEQRRRDDARQAQQNQNQNDDRSNDDDEPPLDWLTPKVYKGSSDVE